MWNRIQIAIALMLAMAPTSAMAWESPVEMGLMTCSFAEPASAPAISDPTDVIGGRKDVECSFRAGLQAPLETYVGTLQFVGQTKDVFGKGALMFVAKAPRSLKSKVGLMEGKYAIQALTQSATQRPLVGEGKSSIILHPLSQMYDRPTLALGRIPGLIVVLELRLKAAPA